MGDVISIRHSGAMATLLAACEEAKERDELSAIVVLFDADDPQDHYAIYSEDVAYHTAHYVLTAIAQRQMDREESYE